LIQNKPLLIFFLLFLTSFEAKAATPKNAGGMPKTPEECKQTAGKAGVNGYMPRGATDENLKEYKDPSRCAANSGRPIDAESCKNGMEKLYEVASELNQMVKRNCEEFIPKFTSDPEVMSCIAAQANKSQSGCTGSALKTLSEVNPIIQEFKAKLKNFKKVLGELQKQGIQVSTETVQVMDEGKQAQGSGAFHVPNSNAQKFGFNTLAETQEFHSGQDPLIAKALLAEFQSRFENSEEQYSDANSLNYAQKVKPIDESWQKLNTVQSRMLREQMHSYLNAEELKLATKLYENQLQEVDAQITKQAAINNQTMNQMGAVAPGMNLLPPPSPESSNDTSSNIADSRQYEIQSGLGKAFTTAKIFAAKTTAEDSNITKTSSEANASAVYSTGNNPSSVTSKSLAKEALKKKLEAMKNTGNANPSASSASIESTADAASDKSENKLDTERSLASLEPLNLRKRDQVLANFSGENLLDSGFQMHGGASDDSVQAIVDGFYSALGDQQLENAGIGSADDVSLFMRVRDFHGKCLKLGCVTGLAKTR
jgi:hypothetical protein